MEKLTKITLCKNLKKYIDSIEINLETDLKRASNRLKKP